jgi:hypothetical protein
LIVVIGAFAVVFGSLVYGAVLFATQTSNLGAMMMSWTWVTIEVLFMCAIFWMSYISLRKPRDQLTTIADSPPA